MGIFKEEGNKKPVRLWLVGGLGLLLAGTVSCATIPQEQRIAVEMVDEGIYVVTPAPEDTKKETQTGKETVVSGKNDAKPDKPLAASTPAEVVPPPLVSAPAFPATGGGFQVYQYMPDASKSLGTETLLSEISKEVAGKVFYELKEEGEKNFTARVAVVAAVPLSDLKRETEFGRVMGEYLLTDLADRGLRVTELRLGKEINILPQTGEFIMSRNLAELANHSQELDYVVVTTYSNTRKTLILQGRLVDLKDGLVKSSWRYGLPLNRELLGLFQEVEPSFRIAIRGGRQ